MAVTSAILQFSPDLFTDYTLISYLIIMEWLLFIILAQVLLCLIAENK